MLTRIIFALKCIAIIQISITQSQFAKDNDSFVYPKAVLDSMCTFQNNSRGICVPVHECPQSTVEYYNEGIKPTTCYFEKDLPVVCCAENIKKTIGQIKWNGQRSFKSVESCNAIHYKPTTTTTKPSDDEGEFQITVVGGELTTNGEFPHMAALGWSESNDPDDISWKCGGTLISHNYVMTAAHCTSSRNKPPTIIRTGAKELRSTDSFILPQDFGIADIIVHPNYRSGSLYHDIALIKLNKSILITQQVRPACLWQDHSINFTQATATGYGHVEFAGKASNDLLKADLKIFDNQICVEGYRAESTLANGILDSQLCAGDLTGEKDTCQGDSGGPLQVHTIQYSQTVYHIVGITSFGRACASNVPGVYTRVSHYLNWIENIVWP